MLSTTTIERIRELPVYDIVSRYIDLKKAGTNYTALSPFTNEKTPSFYVVPKKNIFKCFSTGKGGDAIRFVMEFNNMDFVAAVIDIAGKVGEKVEYETSEKATEEQTEREQLFKINAAAAKRYADEFLKLPEHHPAHIELMVRRKFTKDTILQWQIGFAPTTNNQQLTTGYTPDNWKFLTSILHEKALIGPALKIGLLTEKDKTVYDTFRNRIMFPIHNHLGRVVGFGGRALATDQFNAKYINSSDSALFDKKRVLFGLHFAAQAIRKNKWAGLVEGYTDVISFHQAGYENTVGTCGTALTPEQCTLLKKYASKVVLFPDPDSAGEASAMRSIDLLMQHGFETAVVPMPHIDDGKKIDPDELIRMFELETLTT